MSVPTPKIDEEQEDFIARCKKTHSLKECYLAWKKEGKRGLRGGDRGGPRRRPLRMDLRIEEIKRQLT